MNSAANGGTDVEAGLHMASELLHHYAGERAGCQQLVVFIGDGEATDTTGTVARTHGGYWSCCCDDGCCTCWVPPKKQYYGYSYAHAKSLAASMFENRDQHTMAAARAGILDARRGTARRGHTVLP